jgi:hypothetical protein
MLPFEHAQNELIHPYFTGYLRAELGLFIATKDVDLAPGRYTHVERQEQRISDTTVEVTYARVPRWYGPRAVRSGPELGLAIAQERTIPGPDAVKVPQLYVGYRWTESMNYGYRDGHSVHGSMTGYFQLLKSIDFQYPDSYTGQKGEFGWGGRLGFEIMYGIGRHSGVISAFDVAVTPTARGGDAAPGFRMFISVGYVFGV